MGWSSGSRVFGEVVELIVDNVPNVAAREAIYRGMIDIFENADCDTLCECYEIDPVLDDILNEIYDDA